MPPFSKKIAPAPLPEKMGKHPLCATDFPEYVQHAALISLLEAYQGAVVKAELKLRASGQVPRVQEVINADDLHARADHYRRNPPAVGSPPPQTMSGILIERLVIDRAIVLAQADGRRIFASVFNAVRTAREPEYIEASKAYVAAVAAAVRAERARDAIFNAISYGAEGRIGMPMCDARLQCGRQSMAEFFHMAVRAQFIAPDAVPSCDNRTSYVAYREGPTPHRPQNGDA